MSEIEAKALSTFAVSPDGTQVSIHMQDESGAPATLVLPTTCLAELMMTLPKMLRLALQKQYGDDSLRLVHELGNYRVEQMAGANRLIVTLGTPDGFEVSFAFSNDNLADLAGTLPDETPASRAASLLM